MLNLALVGPGRIADTRLAPALQRVDGAQLWSVLSRDRGRASAFAERHGAASASPAYTDMDALLADSALHGVIIAGPDGLHAEQALAAIQAGKHVLVEKPITTSVDDADELVQAAEEHDVRLGVAYHLRWHAGHRLIHESVHDGDLGPLRHMRVQYTWQAQDDTNWRAHPEVGRFWSLGGVGTHALDLIRWLMVPTCGDIEEITSVISRAVWQGPHDETAVCAMRFESGATAEFCSSVQFAAPSRVEVYGSEDYAVATGTLGGHGGGRIETSAGDLPFNVADPYQGEIQDFVEAVRDGRPPEVDGEEGLENVQLMEWLIGE